MAGRTTETGAHLLAAIDGIAAVRGRPMLGLTSAELRATEKRLGVRLPPVLRQFHAACGADPGALSTTPLGQRIVPIDALRVDAGVLVVVDTPAPSTGEECGIKLTETRRHPRVRSPFPSEGALGPGAYLERATPAHPWRGRVLGLATRLRELVTFAAVVSLPHVVEGPIEGTIGKADVDVASVLERTGADVGMRTLVDTGRTVLVRYDAIGHRVTIGGRRAKDVERVARALSAQTRPRRPRGRR